MSQQSINKNSIEKFEQESKEILIYNTENYFYNKHFKIGKRYDIDEMNYYRHLRKMLCESDCEIKDLIYKKLNGQLTEKPNKLYTRLSDLVNLLEIQENKPQEEFMHKMYWNDVAW